MDTLVHVVVTVLQLYINTHSIQGQTHICKHTFSHKQKTPAVYFVTDSENRNTNNMPHASAPTTCLIADKGTDTQSLSPHLSLLSFFFSFLCSLFGSYISQSIITQLMFLASSLNLIHLCDKGPERHMEPVNISLFIHSCVSHSTSGIHHIDPVCHQAGMWPCNVSECSKRWLNRWGGDFDINQPVLF